MILDLGEVINEDLLYFITMTWVVVFMCMAMERKRLQCIFATRIDFQTLFDIYFQSMLSALSGTEKIWLHKSTCGTACHPRMAQMASDFLLNYGMWPHPFNRLPL
ncbi:hypothetical protein CUJ89_36465 [Burkholderia pyrrocinia]|uniref:Uncharacterized protein n=1 Tax=Burkholderia pyrrocinia TaxID=60550 RepID=A0A2Z5N9W4_BURPY|nr:hypothetical protein CUJ89_36465 [Burkholderia pyrrocinia]